LKNTNTNSTHEA